MGRPEIDTDSVGRCEGYYRLENRRCDRGGERWEPAADGGLYLLCGYHRRHAKQTAVARWDGETGLRRGRSTAVRAAAAPITGGAASLGLV